MQHPCVPDTLFTTFYFSTRKVFYGICYYQQHLCCEFDPSFILSVTQEISGFPSQKLHSPPDPSPGRPLPPFDSLCPPKPPFSAVAEQFMCAFVCHAKFCWLQWSSFDKQSSPRDLYRRAVGPEGPGGGRSPPKFWQIS